MLFFLRSNNDLRNTRKQHVYSKDNPDNPNSREGPVVPDDEGKKKSKKTANEGNPKRGSFKLKCKGNMKDSIQKDENGKEHCKRSNSLERIKYKEDSDKGPQDSQKKKSPKCSAFFVKRGKDLNCSSDKKKPSDKKCYSKCDDHRKLRRNNRQKSNDNHEDTTDQRSI